MRQLVASPSLFRPPLTYPRIPTPDAGRRSRSTPTGEAIRFGTRADFRELEGLTNRSPAPCAGWASGVAIASAC